jgi:hypothetical protein
MSSAAMGAAAKAIAASAATQAAKTAFHSANWSNTPTAELEQYADRLVLEGPFR